MKPVGRATAVEDSGRAARLARRLVIAAVALAALAVAATSLIPWLPLWQGTLLEYFRLQYVEVGVAVVVGAAVLRLRGYFDVAVLATLANLLPIAADLSAPRRAAVPEGTPIRVLVLNVHTENTSYARVRRLIADEQPDLIGLVEVDRRWLDAIAPAVAAYPGRIEEPRAAHVGVALYARGRVAGSAEALGSPSPSVVADVAIGAAQFRAIVTHPRPPTSYAAMRRQQAQLDAIADQARAGATPVLLMGDINATPWSRPFLRLLRRSGLCDSRAGFGVQASYPAASPLLRIPIDHLLASCSVGVRDRRIGRDVGSDHLPVIVDLVVPTRR